MSIAARTVRPPATSVTAIKTFDNAPLEFRLGRFQNPYEPYSAYWDGALMRVGGRTGPGIGVVAGFEPQRGNEGFSQDVTKVTGFADFSARGSSWSYSSDASFHVLRSDVDGLADQTFAGWSQQLSLGRMTFNQRLRVDRAAGSGEWTLAQLRVRTGVSVAGPLRLNVGYSRPCDPGCFVDCSRCSVPRDRRSPPASASTRTAGRSCSMWWVDPTNRRGARPLVLRIGFHLSRSPTDLRVGVATGHAPA